MRSPNIDAPWQANGRDAEHGALSRLRLYQSFWHLVRRTVSETIDDGCASLAAELAFYFLLGVFPALLLIVALISSLPIEPALAAQLARANSFLPGDVIRVIEEQLDRLMAGPGSGLLTFGIATAVWSSSSAMTAIITALNRAYDIEEFRPWWKLRVVAIFLTMALSLFVVLAFGLVIGGTDLARWIAERAGIGEAFTVTWGLLQWPLAFLIVVTAVDIVYHVAPNADRDWVWFTPGSLLATGLWLLVSFGFKLYVDKVSDYSSVYGTIGGFIVLMLWFYFSGLALLIGAELNAEIDAAHPAHDTTPQGPHHRKRIHA